MLILNFFFFNDTATTEIYTLSLHDALPISIHTESGASLLALVEASPVLLGFLRHFGCSFCRQAISDVARSEEHTSELQSLTNLVCRLLLGKKNRISARR